MFEHKVVIEGPVTVNVNVTVTQRMPEVERLLGLVFNKLAVSDEKLGRILGIDTSILKQEQKMALDYSRISASVAQTQTVAASIDTVVKGMAQQLRDQSTAASDLADAQARMNAFADALDASNATIQADVVANTQPASTTAGAPASAAAPGGQTVTDTSQTGGAPVVTAAVSSATPNFDVQQPVGAGVPGVDPLTGQPVA